jgi:DNA-directed RNA polymerase beta' subunit
MEMNIHIPQSVEAAIELRMIAAIPQQIISPQNSLPIIGILQDALLGANRFTRPTVAFSRKDAMNLLVFSKMWNGKLPEPAVTTPQPMWTGLQLISAILPPLNLTMKNGQDQEVEIKRGNLTKGMLDSDVFSKNLIHIMYNDYGPDATIDFIDAMQAMMGQYLVNTGFSVGISDLVADEITKKKFTEAIKNITNKTDDMILQVHTGLFENSSGRSNQENFEMKMIGTLKKATDEAGSITTKSLSDNNRMTNMIKSGSKGSNLNVSQMIAVLGQQEIEVKRVPYGFQNRTLPHFKRFDDSARARGFINSSFMNGLEPDEFFFHAISGREGMIDTAVKSVTGDTMILIIEEGIAKHVPIGDWIDSHLAKADENEIEHHKIANLELYNLPHEVYIPTPTAKGGVSWEILSAITRHDCGKTLYEVKTASGRTVIVPESKSILVWNEETATFVAKPTPEVAIGEFVPVTISLPSIQIVESENNYLRLLKESNELIQKKIDSFFDGSSRMATIPSTEPVEIIYALCARLGLYTEFSTKGLVIYKEIPSTVRCVEDVILDPITEITILTDTGKYPKLYDVTVPSTLNFCLANGLGVLDTASTGYIQRRIRVAMEDLIAHHDGSVRDSTGTVIQFAYGEDGMNATRIESQPIDLVNLSEAQLRSQYVVPDATGDRQVNYTNQVVADRTTLVEKVFNRQKSTRILYPVHLKRLVEDIAAGFHLKPKPTDPVTGDQVLEAHTTILQKTRSNHVTWGILLRHVLAPHKLKELGFTKPALDALVQKVILTHWKAWVEPGQPVGVISAQSIGEILTQMTLKTFHTAGASNMTSGIPRLDELLKVTKNPKMIECIIPLRKDLRESKEEARRAAQSMEFTLLQDLVTTSCIYYDPRDDATLLQQDAEWLAYFIAYEAAVSKTTVKKSSWLLRFELDREKMFAKNISMDDIAYILKVSMKVNATTMYSDFNASQLVFRLRLADSTDTMNDQLIVLKQLQNKILMTTAVRGIPGLRTVGFKKVNQELELVDGVYKTVDQFVLVSDGSNLLEILCHPSVDPTRVYSNNVYDMYENFGIEAARTLLLKELMGTIPSGIHTRHTGMLVDRMTAKGRLMACTRFGINKLDIGSLAKASFEQTEEIMLKSALYGERDPVLGVSANIMLGSAIHGGTSFTDVLYDETAAIKFKKEAPPPPSSILELQTVLTQEQIDSKLFSPAESGFVPIDAAMPSSEEVLPVEEEEFELDLVVE